MDEVFARLAELQARQLELLREKHARQRQELQEHFLTKGTPRERLELCARLQVPKDDPRHEERARALKLLRRTFPLEAQTLDRERAYAAYVARNGDDWGFREHDNHPPMRSC